MKVYVVMVDDCTGSFIHGIFANKEIAEREKKKCESIANKGLDEYNEYYS
jgi:hypothetical protein